MSAHLAAATDRVLIVGTGLTGALTCYHLRKALRDRIKIDVADMARGAGGRMSTTRYEGKRGSVRANTGAQYVSALAITSTLTAVVPETEIGTVLGVDMATYAVAGSLAWIAWIA